MTAAPKAFSISEALRFGWEKTLENLGAVVTVGLVGGLLGVMSDALTARGHGFSALVLNIPIALARVAATLVMLRVALAVYDEQRVSTDQLWGLTRGYVPFLLTSIVLGALTSVGFALLVVPGVYLLLRFGFATCITADTGLSPLAALKASDELTHGIKGELLGFVLALVGVNLLGAAALGVGLLLSVPTSVIAAVYVYRRLERRARGSAVAGPTAFTGPLAPAS